MSLRSRLMAWLSRCSLLPFLVLASVACSRELSLGSDQPTQAAAGKGNAGMAGTAGTAGRAGTAGTAGALGSAGEAPCVRSACHGTVYACGDCDDDDGDGLVDADDGECTGPCDDEEDSFAVGLPGESSSSCQLDCFFNPGRGAGNDDCHFSLRCDARSVAPDYPPSGQASCEYDESSQVPGAGASCSELRATQSDACLATCGPLTPNGCDCFGCCELPAGTGRYIWLGASSQDSGCDEADLEDSDICRPCTPVPSCLNECEPCELCVGRPEPLETCGDTGTSRCATGYDPCGRPGDDACRVGSYCVTGCCIPEPR